MRKPDQTVVQKARKRGRPPAAVGHDGKPEMTSQYPTLTVAIRPATKRRLTALMFLKQMHARTVIDNALEQYMNSLSEADKKAIDTLMKKVEATTNS